MNNPKVFISYSRESPEHNERVLSLSNRLCSDGIDCMIDQYNPAPPSGWPLWMEEQIQMADFVLMVCTEIYHKRIHKKDDPDKGFGVCWEASLIYNSLYHAKLENNKFIPVIYDIQDQQYIPLPLQGFSYYLLLDGYESLYQRLTNQIPEKPVFGKLKKPTPRLEKALRHLSKRICLNNAPLPLEEWVGREELLKELTSDWMDHHRSVASLIGPGGGEGKSSLAREWLSRVLENKTYPQPDGVFWWGFYENRNADQFFDAALRWLYVDSIDPSDISSLAKSHYLSSRMLYGRYLFILDGLEVMQFEDDKRRGKITNDELREFLALFSKQPHQSFCLITSRIPLVDLKNHNSYTEHWVRNFDLNDGCALLHKLGIKEPKAFVSGWGGHALSLKLLADYLIQSNITNLSAVEEIPISIPHEVLYDRVAQILQRYTYILTDAEVAFLLILCTFRIPVQIDSFEKILRDNWGVDAINEPIISLTDVEYKNMVEHLVDTQIIRCNSELDQYTMHPLIRQYYLER